MGKVVAITGASSGIGRAAAEHFGPLGMPVALLARREERLEAIAQSRKRTSPGWSSGRSRSSDDST